MTFVLLDTDACIDILRGIAASVRLAQVLASEGEIFCICDPVIAEVYSGLHPHERERGRALLADLLHLPTGRQAAQTAGMWRYTYARQGRALHLADTLIAATAVHHRARLLTGNLKDYPMPDVDLLPLPRS